MIDDFKTSLPEMDDKALYQEARKYIFLSAYAANNSRSAYHPMCDATYDEAVRRNKPAIYAEAYEDEVKAHT